jgi:CheY-like chemotaxis protein
VDRNVPRVLVVDDNPLNLRAFKAVLTEAGYEVITASSGRKALEEALNDGFAVIVLDVRMPEMDGFEVAALLRQREHTRYTPIIFTSAYDQSAMHVSKAYRAGATDYLFSPVNDDVLKAKVDAFVEIYLRHELLKAQIKEMKEAIEQLCEDLNARSPGDKHLLERVRQLQGLLGQFERHFPALR